MTPTDPADPAARPAFSAWDRLAWNALSAWTTDALLAGREVDLVNLVSASRGWLPLAPGAEMTAHFRDAEYVIRRTQ